MRVYICDAPFFQVEEVLYMVLLECDALGCFAVTMQPYWKRPVELSPANWPPLESIKWAMQEKEKPCLWMAGYGSLKANLGGNYKRENDYVTGSSSESLIAAHYWRTALTKVHFDYFCLPFVLLSSSL